jgi:putative glycosyltransferase (TIGR04372 family)
VKKITKIKTFLSKQVCDIKLYGIKELLRKFFIFTKVITRTLIDVIAVLPCIIIRLLSPWIIIRIARAPSTNYGNFARDLALYCCKKKLKIDQPKKKYIDLFYILPRDNIHNRQLARMWKRKLIFFSGYLLDPINRVGKFIPGWKLHTIGLFPSKYELDVDNLIAKYQALHFTAEEEIYGKKMLNKFGLKDNDKFICLVVRDSKYQLKKISARYHDWSYHDYRNYDIDHFVLAAEELTKRGYFVFRMGVVANKPMKSDNPKIIDYVNTKLRSDFMDVYLGAKCTFCISTGLGFDEVPYIFRRPIALLSVPLGDLRSYSEKFLLLSRLHILEKEKRKLSLSEIFSHGVGFAYDTKIFKQKGIKLLDYTPEQIKDFAIEMAENLENEKKLNPEEEELQKIFKNLFSYNVQRLEYLKEIKKPPYKFHGQIRSRYSMKFLKENRDWLK